MKKIINTFQRRMALLESKIIHVVKDTTYGGIEVTDESGNWIGTGEMVADLLKADVRNFFNTPDGSDPAAMKKMQTSIDKNVQGGIERWDSDVFPEYYNVDFDRLTQLFAKQNGAEVQEDSESQRNDGEGYDSDGSYESSNPFTSLEESRP